MLITISREFGSGGRELGKRLSDVLEIPCYDKEIIQMIAEKQGFDERYVSHISEKNLQAAYPLTIGHRFTMTPHPVTKQAVAIAVEQQRIIKTFAEQEDCIMIGRCADVILKEYSPFNIFVYADMDTKLKRCIERAPEGENLTRTELERKIWEVDKERTRHREFYMGAKGNINSNYHLCINTSGIEIKKVVPMLAEYIKVWFEIRGQVYKRPILKLQEYLQKDNFLQLHISEKTGTQQLSDSHCALVFYRCRDYQRRIL